MYYLQYRFSKTLWDNDAQFSALIGTSLTLMAQFTFLIVTLAYVFKVRLIADLLKNLGPTSLLIYYIIFLIFTYFVFYYNNKWKKILEEFQNRTDLNKKKEFSYLFIYLFTCFLLVFYPIIFKVFFNVDLRD